MQEKSNQDAQGLSGKGWWRKVIKTANIVAGVAEVVVAAPLKLPLKLLLAIRSLAVIANLFQVVEKEAKPDE